MTPTFIFLAVLYYVACTAGALWAFAKSDGYISAATAILSVGFGWVLLLPWLLLDGFIRLLYWLDATVMWRSKRRSARMVLDD